MIASVDGEPGDDAGLGGLALGSIRDVGDGELGPDLALDAHLVARVLDRR